MCRGRLAWYSGDLSKINRKIAIGYCLQQWLTKIHCPQGLGGSNPPRGVFNFRLSIFFHKGSLIKMSKKIPLKQFLMRTGRFEKLYDAICAVRSQKITINGKAIENPNYFFNPGRSSVKFGDEMLMQVKKLYFILNKPAGYICQKSIKEKSIYDLIKGLNIEDKLRVSLFAVGRLDKETEGLLIITNDGKLSSSITKPDNKIEKEYYAVLSEAIKHEGAEKIKGGIEIIISGIKYKTRPAKIRIIGEKEIAISVSEGKKRQIRKMLEAIGNSVVYLRRESIGNLNLGGIKPVEFKEIIKEEIYKKINIS